MKCRRECGRAGEKENQRANRIGFLFGDHCDCVCCAAACLPSGSEFSAPIPSDYYFESAHRAHEEARRSRANRRSEIIAKALITGRKAIIHRVRRAIRWPVSPPVSSRAPRSAAYRSQSKNPRRNVDISSPVPPWQRRALAATASLR